ncbi:MAG: RagB/SusD family nutrient uptake outer membrane protein [Bacteroidetes bacterium]|nr:RagB/SusD family nutrient uptake outer membrane protein [Bacteroidota bacterium]
MKKHFTISRFYTLALAATLLLPLLSCNKQLELAPENTLVDKDVFSTQAGAEQALAEAFYYLLTASYSDAYMYGDYTTNELLGVSSYDIYRLGQATPVDTRVVGFWTNYFKAVNTANNIIAKIPVYGNFDAAMEAQYIAEAKFIRAYAYLDLLKLYGDGALTDNPGGLGLPLQLTPFEGYTTGQVVPRSTNAQVYAQIVKDLTDALPALPDKQGNDLATRSRATKGAANALLARTYLYMRQYNDAAAAAKLVIDKTSIYSLVSDLRVLFPPNPNNTAQALTTEHIFALPVSQAVSSSSAISYGPGWNYYYKLYFWINPDFKNGFETGDNRVSQLMYQGDVVYNYQPLYQTTYKFNNSNGRDNVPLIRLAEVMLTRAEALARVSGINAESLSLLNAVRSRSVPAAVPYQATDFGSGTALVNVILLQRDYELAFEGQYRYDQIRTGRPLRSPDIAANRKVLPIPQSEIDISAGVIKQNTGYQ